MYLRTIGRRFTEMIAYFLAATTKPGSDHGSDHGKGSLDRITDRIMEKKNTRKTKHKRIIILI